MIYILFLILSLRIATSIQVIIASPYYPMVNCSLEEPLNQDLVFGIEIDFVRDALTILNMKQGRDYIFECRDWDVMFNDIKFANSTILGGIGGITITSSRMADGYIFSQPTYLTGMSILFNNKKKMWFFARAISLGAALLLIAIPLTIGFVIYFLEFKQQNLIDYIFHGLFFFFHMKLLEYLTIPSKLISQSLWLFILVFSAFYTSIVTNLFQNDQNYGGLYSVDNKSGKTFHVLDIYSDILLQMNFIVIPFPGISLPEQLESYIKNHDVTYLATDSPILDYLEMTNCNYYLALHNVIEFEFGMMINSNVNPEFIHLINQVFSNLIHSTSQKAREITFFEKQSIPVCKQKDSLGSDQMSIKELDIMWIIYAIILGFTIMVSLVGFGRKYYRNSFGLLTLEGYRTKQDKILNKKICNYFAFFMGGSIEDLKNHKEILAEPLHRFLVSNPKFANEIKIKYIDIIVSLTNFVATNHHQHPKRSKSKPFTQMKTSKNDAYLDKASRYIKESKLFDSYSSTKRMSGSPSSKLLKSEFKMDDNFQDRVLEYFSLKNKQREFEKNQSKSFLDDISRRLNGFTDRTFRNNARYEINLDLD